MSAPHHGNAVGNESAQANPAASSVETTDEPSNDQVETIVRGPLARTLRLVAVAIVVALLALLVWATLASSRGSNLVRQVADGEKPMAPPFSLKVIWPHTETWPPDAARALADGRLSLTELRGHVVVLNFFASWCVACRDEAPLLHKEAQAHAKKAVFLGLDVQDLTGDARGFAAKYRMNYVALRGSSTNIYDDYGLTGVPESYFIDARGRILAHIPGEVTQSTLAQGIAAATSTGNGGTLPGGAHVKTR